MCEDLEYVETINQAFNEENVPKGFVYGKKFTNANILRVEAGTNTPCGGDGGHGGRTVLRLMDLGGTCWDIEISVNERKYRIESPDSIEIKLYGDAEAETLAQALEFAAKILRKQINHRIELRRLIRIVEAILKSGKDALDEMEVI